MGPIRFIIFKNNIFFFLILFLIMVKYKLYQDDFTGYLFFFK